MSKKSLHTNPLLDRAPPFAGDRPCLQSGSIQTGRSRDETGAGAFETNLSSGLLCSHHAPGHPRPQRDGGEGL